MIQINFRLTAFWQFDIKSASCGDVAQMGERGVRNAEVRGSIPLISTTFLNHSSKLPQCDKYNRVSVAEIIFDVNRLRNFGALLFL